MDAAEYFELVPKGHHGYPQPEADSGYVQRTYDTSDFCETCGIGGVQNAPFRFRKEPRTKHSQFLQLNWIFDEFFVRGEIRRDLDAAGITGLDFVPPVVHKSGETVEGWYQIKVGHILPAALHPKGLQQVTCEVNNEEDWEGDFEQSGDASALPRCGRLKYHMHHRGPFQFDRAAFEGAPDVVKTCEWFGSGGQAFRLILVSQKFRRLLLDNRWRGVSFEPVSLVPES